MSLLHLNLDVLMLEFNRISQPPRKISVLSALADLFHFNMSVNPLQCSCAIQNFAEWITLRNKSMECRSALQWFHLTTKQLAAAPALDCQKPMVEMLLQVDSKQSVEPMSQSWSYTNEALKFRDNVEVTSLRLNISHESNVKINCNFLSHQISTDAIIKVGWMNITKISGS